MYKINAMSPIHTGGRVGRAWQTLDYGILYVLILCRCEIVSGVRKIFRVGSCKTAQREHEENLLLVPEGVMFGGKQETKRVRVSKEDSMDQSQMTEYGRFICSMPFIMPSFS